MLALACLQRSSTSTSIYANALLRSVASALCCTQTNCLSTLVFPVDIAKAASLQLPFGSALLHNQCLHRSTRHAWSQNFPKPAGMLFTKMQELNGTVPPDNHLFVQKLPTTRASMPVQLHAHQVMLQNHGRHTKPRYSVDSSVMNLLKDEAVSDVYQHGRMHEARAALLQGLSDAGWTKAEVYNIPNALSMARLVSGPGIAYLILNEQWALALGSLVVSGASDWADGFVAKRYGQSSVLGSYLDPLADKALIGCVVAALGYQGSLPSWLVALIIGRDAVLLSGAFVHRFQKVGWRWPGAAEFFRVSSSPSTPQSQTHPSGGSAAPSTAQHIHSTSQHANTSSSSTGKTDDHGDKSQGSGDKADQSVDASIAAIGAIGSSNPQQQGSQQNQESSGQEQEAAVGVQSVQPATFVQPLYISKVNTCFQLLLVGGCLTSSWYAWPPQEVLFSIGVITGGTTLASTAAYARAYMQGKIK